MRNRIKRVPVACVPLLPLLYAAARELSYPLDVCNWLLAEAWLRLRHLKLGKRLIDADDPRPKTAEELRRHRFRRAYPIDRAKPPKPYHKPHKPAFWNLRDYSSWRATIGAWGQHGGPVRQVVAAPVPLFMPTQRQRLLERIGRLYKLSCWYDHKGRVPLDERTRPALDFGFNVEAMEAKKDDAYWQTLERNNGNWRAAAREELLRQHTSGNVIPPKRDHAKLAALQQSFNAGSSSLLNRRLHSRHSLNVPLDAVLVREWRSGASKFSFEAAATPNVYREAIDIVIDDTNHASNTETIPCARQKISATTRC